MENEIKQLHSEVQSFKERRIAHHDSITKNGVERHESVFKEMQEREFRLKK